MSLKKNIIYLDFILKALFLLALRPEVLIVLKERSSRLLCFNYDITDRPGAQNVTAYCLSGLPLPCCEDEEPERDLVAYITTDLHAISASDFTTACSACPELCALKTQIQNGWPSAKKALHSQLSP